MILYTFECFWVFKLQDEKARRGSYQRQIIILVLIQFSSFLSICIKNGDIKYIIFYVVLQTITLCIVEIFPHIFRKANRLLINNSCMLISIGIIMLARFDIKSAIKQLIILTLSFILGGFIVFAIKKFKKIPNLHYFYGLLGIVLLLAVYILGSVTNGSKLAIYIFGISFQASEFVKILFVLFVAGFLYENTSFKNIVFTTILAAIHVVLLALSTDLGAAFILFIIYILMVFWASKNYLYLIIGTSAGVVASILSYRIFRHVQVRVLAFLDPFSVIDNEGYQITQSLFAISGGSWFGLGLYNGTPETIPYVETDFIFSAIAQELGIIFSICLILICISCFIMFINIGLRFKDNRHRLISFGLGFTYIIQVFLTIGGGTKFIPLTGVTLPLVSYGGSSIMATIFTISIIEGLYVIRSKQDNADKLKSFKHQSNIIIVFTVLIVSLFIALITYLCYYVSTHEQELINNDYNPRQEELIKQNVRGTIYSRDMEPLAQTIIKNGEETRLYPYHNIFSHVIGYNIKGKAGIEGQANYYLINSNQPLSERIQADINGDKYLADSVVTTLDVELQETAYTAIGGYNGAVVVSNPKTGEIYALVSKPDYDPNEIADIWNSLINDKSSSVLLNRATQGLYPPGSTFKIVTLLEYLKENPTKYNDYRFSCNGELVVNDEKIICYNHTKHYNVNLQKSLAVSCNSSFGNIGLNVDKIKFNETLDKLMFNRQLPLSIAYSQSSASDLTTLDDLSMVRTAFGQGETLMTPIHLNLITQAIANDGILMKPYLISSVINSNLNTVKEFGAEESTRLMDTEIADILTDMMSTVVTEGTAKKLKNKTYTVAGKTGSAEYSDYTNSTHSWFTGFAPVENPEICVTIILENAGTSGLHAVPMAKMIFDEYFKRQDTRPYIEEE